MTGSGNGGRRFGAGDAYGLVFSDERLTTGVRFIDGSGKTLLGVGYDGEGGRVIILILVLVPVLNERGPTGSVFLYKSSKRKRHYLFYYFLVFGKKKINFFI